jgi:hypothetical protein
MYYTLYPHILKSKYSSQNIVKNQAYSDRVAAAYVYDFNAEALFERKTLISNVEEEWSIEKY